MNDTKRQHFIPCCYLKYFSVDGTWANARKTKIFFTDGDKSNSTRVTNLGIERYTYSKENPEFDKQFHDMEKHYPRIIEKILGGDTSLNPFDYFGLFMIMADFNHRNVAYENRAEVERMHVYEAISRSFMSDVFAEARGYGKDLHGIKEWLEDNWRILRIEPETEEKFITSDNPSTIFSNPSNGRPVMIYLPAHPRIAVIAYDQRHIKAESVKATDAAIGLLNGLQINRCVRHTFSDHDLSEDEENWKTLQKLAEREKPIRWVDDERWQPDFIPTDNKVFERLTFVKRLNPRNRLSEMIKAALL